MERRWSGFKLIIFSPYPR